MRTGLVVVALALCCGALPASAQDSGAAAPAQQTPIPGQKSGTAATLLSLLSPGVGHMYAGETGKGVALFAVGTGSLIVGTYMWQRGTVESCRHLESCLEGTVKQAGWAYAGYGIWLVTYVWGIADAANAAQRMNERNARRGSVDLLGTTLQPVAGPTPGGLTLGMRIALRR